MIRLPPRSTRTDTLFPYTTLFRSGTCARSRVLVASERQEDRQVKLRECCGNSVDVLGVPASVPSRPYSDQQLHGDCSRSEEHTSELQSLMRISYAVFCLKKKKTTINNCTEEVHNTSEQTNNP